MERLHALSAAFATRLAADAARLRELTAQLDSVSADELVQTLTELRAIAHRLHGTAPAFDASDIGEASGRLELALVDSAEPRDAGVAIRERLNALLRLLDAALGAHGPPREFTPKLG